MNERERTASSNRLDNGTAVTVTNEYGTESATIFSASNPCPGEIRTYVVKYADGTFGNVNDRQVAARKREAL